MRLRQDRISSEERLEALLNYRKPDRIPISSLPDSKKNMGCLLGSSPVPHSPWHQICVAYSSSAVGHSRDPSYAMK